MRHFLIIEARVKELTWIPKYMKEVPKIVKQYGGRCLTRTSFIEQLEGEAMPPQYTLIVEFPSIEDATAFYESEEYSPHKASRQAGAECKTLLVAEENTCQADSV